MNNQIMVIADEITQKLEQVLESINPQSEGAAQDIFAAAETLKILHEIYNHEG